MSETKPLSSTMLAREYSVIFKPEDHEGFKHTAEHHFSVAVKLALKLKRKKRFRELKLSLIHHHLGFGFEAIVKAAYLKAQRCINQLQTTNATIHNIPTHQLMVIGEENINAKEVFSLNQLIIHYKDVFLSSWTSEHLEAARLLMLLRNRAGHLPFSVTIKADHYELMLSLIRKVYADAFCEDLKFTLDVRKCQRSKFKSKSCKLSNQPVSQDLSLPLESL